MLPEDDEAFAIVEGVLRADASPTRRRRVAQRRRRRGRERRRSQRAGRSAGASGARRRRSSPSSARWRRAHAASGAPAAASGCRSQLRRPSRYLDPGVPDEERALARRGTTLVGTVKSGALVEVLARGSWSTKRLARRARLRAPRDRRRASAAGAPQSAAIVAAIVIGDRAGLDDDVQRRLQEAGTYHVIAISGGNIAILAGLLLGAFRLAGWLGRDGDAGVDRACWSRTRDLVGGGASVDRATLMAVVYFGGARDRSAQPAAEHAGASSPALLVAADPLVGRRSRRSC